MPEPLGSCALCPMLDYKLPRRWSDSHSVWADWRAGAPEQVPMLQMSFCAGSPPHLLTAPQTLPPRAPNSWISSQAAANTDVRSPALGAGRGWGRGEACATGTHPSLGGM